MTHDPYYELFHRESEGAERRFSDSRHTYAEAESEAIALFKSEKVVEVEVFEIAAERRRRVFSAYRDRRGYIYGQKEDEVDQVRKRREERRQREKQQKKDT